MGVLLGLGGLPLGEMLFVVLERGDMWDDDVVLLFC